MTTIRTTTTIAISGLLAGCAAASATSGGAAVTTDTPSAVSQILVQHIPGGWGSGPSYTITLHRDGFARFEGKQQAPRVGTYTAPLPAPAFDSLATYLLAQPFLGSDQHSTNYRVLIAPPRTRPDECVDGGAVLVTVFIRGQERTLVDECRGTGFLARYIAPVETLSERLAWQAQ